MAYETGTSTDMADLVSKLVAFAVLNGWKQDQLNTTSGQAAISVDDTYISFRWEPSVNTTLGIYQALGYQSTSAPGQHPNDSGAGVVSGTATTIATGRSIAGVTAPYTAYHFFAPDVNAAEKYIYVVLEHSAGLYRHAGFGQLVKFGDGWRGGSFCYAHKAFETGGSAGPLSNASTAMLDGLYVTNDGHVATMHVENLKGQTSPTKWGAVWGGTAASSDRDSVARSNIQGGFRASLFARTYSWLPTATYIAGQFVPFTPISVAYRAPSNEFQLLGHQPDCAALNIGAFTAAQILTLGGDRWIVFPLVNKISAATANSGLAYRLISGT